MNKSETTELKRLTKAINKLMGKVKNIEEHVFAQQEALEGNLDRAYKNVQSKKGKKARKSSVVKPTKSDVKFYCSCRTKPYSELGMHGDAKRLGHIVTAKAKGHTVKTEAEYNKLSEEAKKEFHN